jgi:hypothetical protein
MKTHKLKNGLIVISVQKDAERFEIINGILEYAHYPSGMRFDTIALHNNYQILGTLTKDSCDFDLLDNCLAMSFESFKQLIEHETDFLFENKPEPIGSSDPNAIDDYIEEYREWEYNQDRVIEKLLILKEND